MKSIVRRLGNKHSGQLDFLTLPNDSNFHFVAIFLFANQIDKILGAIDFLENDGESTDDFINEYKANIGDPDRYPDRLQYHRS